MRAPLLPVQHCHRGQFPMDVELDIENRELSPGVRRMLAAVGQEARFEQARKSPPSHGPKGSTR